MEVAVDVESQQIPGVIARPASLRGRRPPEAERRQIELTHEGVEKTHRIVRADVVVEDFGEEHRLRTIGTGDVGHGVGLRAGGALAKHGDAQYMEDGGVFTQAPPGPAERARSEEGCDHADERARTMTLPLDAHGLQPH
jgi:hypothetical protein